MKLNKYIYAVVAAAMTFASCSDSWTEPQAKVFENQENLKRLVPFLEIKSEADMTPSMRRHYESLADYRKKDRVLGFGWFGSWTAEGSDPMRYLRTLPDSVDMVSLWGTRGNLSESQKADLEYFQKYKHGKAMLCWIVDEVGAQLTPVGRTASDYWVVEKGGGDFLKAAEAYADAIADTIVKYNLDGFDIDIEPGYGHASDWSELINYAYGDEQRGSISPEGLNKNMHYFIKRLYDRFKAEEAKDGKKRIIAVDGEPYYLSNETAEMVDFFIFQAYDEGTTNDVLRKAERVNYLNNYQRKTIVTVEFEQTWRTGGIHPESGATQAKWRRYYVSTAYPEISRTKGAQLFDYATLDFPNGIRIAGIGTYHMEYDKLDEPYKWLRAALDRANRDYPGRFN